MYARAFMSVFTLCLCMFQKSQMHKYVPGLRQYHVAQHTAGDTYEFGQSEIRTSFTVR